MSAPYDPTDAAYVDEKDVRDELTRVFDVCAGCRRCIDFCDVFPSLFELLDASGEPDAGRLTPADQDGVVDACFDCGRCLAGCPFSPGRHEEAVDLPMLMLRANAMRRASGQSSARRRLTDRVLGRSDRIGRAATRRATLRRLLNAVPGGFARRFASTLTGVSAERVLPRSASQTFSAWIAGRPIATRESQSEVTVFPTCAIEYQATSIGRDLVAVLEHNGVACSASAAGCCGAPSLRAGDLDRFTKIAELTVHSLAEESGSGRPIVVLQPTCRDVLRHEYVRHIGSPDAALVAERTIDAAEFLVGLYRQPGGGLDTKFSGEVPVSIGHLVDSRRGGDPSRAWRSLMELAGADVTLIDGPSGVGGAWGLRAENDEAAERLADRLVDLVDSSGLAAITGENVLANALIAARTDRADGHPIQVIARAYGISDGGTA